MAEKKLQTSDFVTFYLLRLDGVTKHLKTTPIHYPFLKWNLGRTKAEDEPDESDNVEFNKGRLELRADDWRVQWMEKYNSGGQIEVNGVKKTIKPDQSMYIITRDNPDDKVKVQERIVTEKVEVKVIDLSFAKLLTTDQLEQLCTSNGIEISKYPQTPEGLIQALEDNGNIAK